MKMPVLLHHALPLEYERRWEHYYRSSSDRDRAQEEGLWRRTQTPDNALQSTWNQPSDARRRIVYYLHNFGIHRHPTHVDLIMQRVFLLFSISLPKAELKADLQRILGSLQRGGWKPVRTDDNEQTWSLGDLLCAFVLYDRHPEDIKAGRALPDDYSTLDLTIRTAAVGNIVPSLPWEVLSKGMRIKDNREHPLEVPDLSILKDLKPFHVEVGCGPSIEAGVPALHHLHDLYRVTDLDNGRFIFGGSQDDLIERLLLSPDHEFPKLGELFKASFLAEPTLAHQAMLALRDSGYLLTPVMTNNFDGLIHRVGLQEHFLRRYDEAIPPIDFHREARSLLVIGSHADRRRVQARARARGLPVVYLDPEGYSVAGRFIPYPLEGPRNGDFICRKTATEGLIGLCSELGVSL